MRVFARIAIAAVGTLCALAFFVATAATTSAASSTVTISSSCSGQLFCYKPGAVTVTEGTTVVWSNSTGAEHTVTRCSAAACNGTGAGTGGDSLSGDVPPNGSFSHTFHGKGTYNYYCAIHGYTVMHGTVTVKAPK